MSDLLNALKQYELSVNQSVVNLQSTGTLDQNTMLILDEASKVVPQAAAAKQIVGQIKSISDNLFGSGSVTSRMIDAALHSNVFTAPLNIIKAALGGRVYGTDSYLGAWDVLYHVQGVVLADSQHVPDDAVMPCLCWCIRTLGIFVSGRAHLDALRHGVQQYQALVAVCAETTQDAVRIEAAREVLLLYMPAPGVPGDWVGVVGVYDNPVTAAVMAARLADPNAQEDTAGTYVVPGWSAVSSFLSNTMVWLVGGVLILVVIFSSGRSKR